MKKKLTIPLLFSAMLFLAGCHIERHADLIIYNGKIYTVDNGFSVVEAMVVKNGKIIALGSTEDMLYEFNAKDSIDLNCLLS